LSELPGIDADDEPGVIGSLLIDPLLLADLSLDVEFLAFLAMLGEGFCGFTPQLEVDKGSDGSAVSGLCQIGVVIGERDFYEAFALLVSVSSGSATKLPVNRSLLMFIALTGLLQFS
jgi:hypothetical protein